MRKLMMALMLSTAAIGAQAQEVNEAEVAEARASAGNVARSEGRVVVAQREEGRRGNWGNVMGNRGGGDRQARQAPAAQPQARAEAPRQRWNGGDGTNNNFRGRNRGDVVTQAPAPVVPQAAPQAQNRQDRGNWNGNRGDANRGNNNGGIGQRWDGNREGRGNWDGRRNGGDRGQARPVPVPQPGSSIDRNRDGRVDRAYDRNRNGQLDRNWDRNRDGSLDRRYDGNRDGQLDRRFDRNNNDRLDRRLDRDRDGRYDRFDRRDNRFGNNWNQNWNRGWRNDRRYDWNGHRNRYRNYYSVPRYYNPYGYGYGYQRFGIGIYLESLFFSNRYWINDPWQYRLPTAPYGAQWVRYYNDVLLVDIYSGYVIDTIHNFFL